MGKNLQVTGALVKQSDPSWVTFFVFVRNLIFSGILSNSSVIERNIKYLKQESWFQEFLNNEEYNELIIKNSDVRTVVGSINIKKMSKPKYNKKRHSTKEKKHLSY